ncbi:Bor/Iss family lipoprotein [Halioxenophilus aromaticivorans]|uniref:Bor family protein n=1 Tax=Halioxenophilus aromaticivorans TaxID=1306992 RepID=A0AAV3U554_9ALTE
MDKILIAFALAILMSACSSVTVRTDQLSKNREPPNFQKRYNYYWWGLKGGHAVNVRLECQGKPVEQMQSLYTTSDWLLGLVTVGIYLPRTARIWCMEENNA